MADLSPGPRDTSLQQRVSASGAALQQPGLTYALALGLVAAVLVIRALLAPTLGNQALYLFLTPPVLIAGIRRRIGAWPTGNISQSRSPPLLTGEYSNLTNRASPSVRARNSHVPQHLRRLVSELPGLANVCAMRECRPGKHLQMHCRARGSSASRFSTPFPTR